MSVIVVVEQDGERLSLHFEGSEVESLVVHEGDTCYNVIGVGSDRVAYALEGR